MSMIGINDPNSTLYNGKPNNGDENFVRVDTDGNLYVVLSESPLTESVETVENTWDADGNITQSKTYPSGVTTGQAFYVDYTWDANGNLTKKEESVANI
jgi:YD repeat-containing protein